MVALLALAGPALSSIPAPAQLTALAESSQPAPDGDGPRNLYARILTKLATDVFCLFDPPRAQASLPRFIGLVVERASMVYEIQKHFVRPIELTGGKHRWTYGHPVTGEGGDTLGRYLRPDITDKETVMRRARGQAEVNTRYTCIKNRLRAVRETFASRVARALNNRTVQMWERNLRGMLTV